MSRIAIVSGGSLLLVLGATGPAWAQAGSWPPYPGDAWSYGSGFYLAGYKLLLCWLVVAVWIKTSAWVHRDSVALGESISMPDKIWVPVITLPVFLALLLALWIPFFAAGLLLLLVSHLLPLTIYVVQRNGRVMDEQKVFTPGHIKRSLLGLFSGRKHEVQLPHEMGPPVEFLPVGSNEQENQANLLLARQSPGYIIAKEFMVDALQKRAERVMLDYTREAVAMRYEVDGVWHNVATRDRESGDVMLAVLKKISALDISERRRRQEGKFLAQYDGSKYTCQLASQGTKTGERVVLEVSTQKETFKTLEDLGMRDKLREQLGEVLQQRAGMLIVSAPPNNGLTTTWRVVLRTADRYMREFVSIEDKQHPMPYVENIGVQTYDSAAGQTPDQILPKLLLKQPEVLVVPDAHNAETLKILLAQIADEERFVLTSVRAKDAAEALLRVLAMKPPAKAFAQSVTAVLNVRLIRRLATTCRQPFEPPPQLLKKLGIPQGKVPVMYREWQPPPPGQERPKKQGPNACPFCGLEGPSCGGTGYLGRTAIFELLIVSDEVRQALLKQPTVESIRQAARAAGHRTLQEEGVLLVARGVTSLSELQRVLKQ